MYILPQLQKPKYLVTQLIIMIVYVFMCSCGLLFHVCLCYMTIGGGEAGFLIDTLFFIDLEVKMAGVFSHLPLTGSKLIHSPILFLNGMQMTIRSLTCNKKE